LCLIPTSSPFSPWDLGSSPLQLKDRTATHPPTLCDTTDPHPLLTTCPTTHGQLPPPPGHAGGPLPPPPPPSTRATPLTHTYTPRTYHTAFTTGCTTRAACRTPLRTTVAHAATHFRHHPCRTTPTRTHDATAGLPAVYRTDNWDATHHHRTAPLRLPLLPSLPHHTLRATHTFTPFPHYLPGSVRSPVPFLLAFFGVARLAYAPCRGTRKTTVFF